MYCPNEGDRYRVFRVYTDEGPKLMQLCNWNMTNLFLAEWGTRTGGPLSWVNQPLVPPYFELRPVYEWFEEGTAEVQFMTIDRQGKRETWATWVGETNQAIAVTADGELESDACMNMSLLPWPMKFLGYDPDRRIHIYILVNPTSVVPGKEYLCKEGAVT